MKKFLKSKYGTAILVVAFVGMLFVTVKVLSRQYQINRQIAQLQAHADQIKGDNAKLSDLVNYLNTPQYKEKAAREQLNLKKDGEVVVALPQDLQTTVADSTPAPQLSNPKKWYNYFFHPGT